MAEEPSQIREEIERTRAEMAETVQALGEKVDVKTRLREKMQEDTAQLQRRAAELGDLVREVAPDKAIETVSTAVRRTRQRPWVPAAVGGFVFGFLVSRPFGRTG
jgi:ElaB/YqjD/DUF883 family membrane-anchored ribosome-binding protein